MSSVLQKTKPGFWLIDKRSREEKSHRQQLEQFIALGVALARALAHTRILLKSDSGPEGPNWSYQQICEAFDVSPLTVMQVRKRYVEEGLAAAVYRKKPERVYERYLDGEAEALGL